MKKIKRVTSSGLVMICIYIYIIDVDTYSVGIQSLFWGACSKSLRRKSANLFCIEMVLDVAELGKET